jgi:hypothetical protein
MTNSVKDSRVRRRADMVNMRRLFAPLILVAVTAFGVGVAYRYFWDDPSAASAANYLRSGVHGIGLAASGLGVHLFLNSRLGRWLRRLPLFIEICLRAGLIAIAVSVVAAGLQVMLYHRRLEAAWLVHEFPRIVAIAFVFSVLFGAIFELFRLVGGRVLLNVILGRYRHPTREERVLMFLDLIGSTSLAEKLGEVRMQELLTRFFFDIDEPIVAHGGEVHAYVGDEVIVTWPLTSPISAEACLDCFFAITGRIAEHADSYRQEFGSVPRFRAALHAGPCGDQRMRRFAPPDRIFRGHDQRDGAASGALQGGRSSFVSICRSPETRASRSGSSRRGARSRNAARSLSGG